MCTAIRPPFGCGRGHRRAGSAKGALVRWQVDEQASIFWGGVPPLDSDGRSGRHWRKAKAGHDSHRIDAADGHVPVWADVHHILHATCCPGCAPCGMSRASIPILSANPYYNKQPGRSVHISWRGKCGYRPRCACTTCRDEQRANLEPTTVVRLADARRIFRPSRKRGGNLAKLQS